MALNTAYNKMQIWQDPHCLPKSIDLNLDGLLTINDKACCLRSQEF